MGLKKEVPSETRYYNFQPSYRTYPSNPTSSVIAVGAIWRINYNHTANTQTAEIYRSAIAIVIVLQGYLGNS